MINATKTHEIQTLENDELRLRVSALGGEMLSLYSRRSHLEYLWQRDKRYWDRSSPILFPIVGRITNGEYTYNHRKYRIPSPHGFASHCLFTIRSMDPTHLIAVLTDTSELLKIYPFRFRLEVEYQLRGMNVIVRFRVHNRGDERMYFSLGAHPGFRIPLLEDETFEDFYIEFSEGEVPRRYQLMNCQITGQKEAFPLEDGYSLSLSHDLFTDDAIILDSIQNRHVSIRSRRHQESISISWEHFEYLGLWKPPVTQAKFLCVEPWFGLPSVHGTQQDYLDRKLAISSLEPGEVFGAEYQISLHEENVVGINQP